MRRPQELTYEVAKTLVSYDPQTGAMAWLKPPRGRRADGAVGQSKTSGYHQIQIMGKTYLQHRLAWFLMTGVWPTQVDHKNRDRSDNRWDNLREATVSQNSGNSVRPSAQGLPKGVRPNKGGFQAKIWGTGKWKCLGTYPTPELASEAYKQAAIEKYGDFARW